MQTTIAAIVTNIREELGNPNVSTEITPTQIERQWYRALDEFNDKVGQLELRLTNVVPGQQFYKLKQLFPTIPTIRAVKGVFYLVGENAYNQIVEEYVVGGTATQMLTSATYYATGTMLTSATYYSSGTLLTSATYYATGTLLSSATYFPSATLLSSATYYASGTVINPDYYDVDGLLLVSATTDVDGVIIQTPATYSYPSGTMLTSAAYYASGTLLTPDYYDINGGSGTMYASATYAGSGTDIDVAATYNLDGTLEDIPAVYADGSQESASATYAGSGTDVSASATYADGTQISASATYTDSTYGYYDYDADAATATATEVNNALTVSTGDASLQIISDMQNAGADPLYERDFQFIDPDQLLLLPAPVDSGALLMLIQTDFTTDTLSDRYERIVTDYAIARCQDVIGNARARLNTPQRNGDLVKYASREKSAYAMSANGKAKFENECAAINIKRIF